MFIEKKRKGTTPRLLTADSAAKGLIATSSTKDLFVKQKIWLWSDTQPRIQLEIKRFVSSTSFLVGLPKDSIVSRYDLSAYTVADNAKFSAEEQDRPGITDKDYNRAAYMEEPIVAHRVVNVDENGDLYGQDNPIPVTDTPETVTLKIENYLINTANTNETINLPANIRRFKIKPRGMKGPLRIYDGTEYYTIDKGSHYDSGEIRTTLSSLTIQSSQGSTEVELFYWVLDT